MLYHKNQPFLLSKSRLACPTLRNWVIHEQHTINWMGQPSENNAGWRRLISSSKLDVNTWVLFGWQLALVQLMQQSLSVLLSSFQPYRIQTRWPLGCSKYRQRWARSKESESQTYWGQHPSSIISWVLRITLQRRYCWDEEWPNNSDNEPLGTLVKVDPA